MKAHAEARARKEGYAIGAAPQDQNTSSVCKQASTALTRSPIAGDSKPVLNR